MTWVLHPGDCRTALQQYPEHHFASAITDAPYEIKICGESWDCTGVAMDPAAWVEVLRVLKPGAYLLNFTAARTYHRIASAIESVGFIIHSPIQWLFGTGMNPGGRLDAKIDKYLGAVREVVGTRTLRGNAAMDCSAKGGNYSVGVDSRGRSREVPITEAASLEAQRWVGWGFHLKPAHETIVLAQKPCDGTKTENVLKWGVGGLNLQACAVPVIGSDQVRLPPNVALNHAPECTAQQCALWCPVRHLDVSTGNHPSAGNKRPTTGVGAFHGNAKRRDWAIEEVSKGDSGTAARYFPQFRYCAKASRSEKTAKGRVEAHRTTKPLQLVRWLVTLVTPPGGLVIDPFAGSGTTLIACEQLRIDSVGVELRPEAVRQARKRVVLMTGQEPKNSIKFAR